MERVRTSPLPFPPFVGSVATRKRIEIRLWENNNSGKSEEVVQVRFLSPLKSQQRHRVGGWQEEEEEKSSIIDASGNEKLRQLSSSTKFAFPLYTSRYCERTEALSACVAQ